MSSERRWGLVSITILLWAAHWHQCNSTHFYGEELAATLASNGTDLIITINWRLTWKANQQPSSESLNTCVTGFGTCANGPRFIEMKASTAICKSTITAMDGTQFAPWTGQNTEMHIPLSNISANYSTIYMTFQDANWGLVTAFGNSGNFGGQLIVMTSRRKDKYGFNSTPRSPVAAIVVLFPGCDGYNFTIPTNDPDGDVVWCRWSTATAECNRCCKKSYPASYPFTLSDDCVLTYTGGLVTSKVYYAVCIQMEDYYATDVSDYEAAIIADNGSNQTAIPPVRLSSASLQFVVEISPNINPCQAVSPLINDVCSLGLVGGSTPALMRCTQNISSVVLNVIVSNEYDNSINATVELNCSDGYYPNPSNLSVTCVQTNATSAQWVAEGQCSPVINYCSAANGDTSGTGLMGQVNDISSVSCGSGYTASSNGAPTYQCTVSNDTGGIWVYSGGSCVLAPSSPSTALLSSFAPTTTAVAGLAGWAIGLISVGAVIAALAVVALLAAATLGAMWFFGLGCFAPAAKSSMELMAEEDPIALARVVRRRRNKVDSSNKKSQDEQRESVERHDGERVQSASSSGSGDSGAGRSLSSVTGLLNDDYYLHPFRHTRTSVNKEVFGIDHAKQVAMEYNQYHSFD